jgi:dolichyl-phosphate-mannose-protein mannosyltransferase
LSSISKVIASLANLLNSARARRRIYRFGPWLVIALAAVLRLWQLGYPKKLVFDETYYVKDAWTLWNTGSEKSWPAEPNAAFESGLVNTFLTDPSFVVHPPLGKWLIGFGMWLFGADNSFSWRISTALIGIAAVGLLMLVARELFKSQGWALAAGFLFAIDGHAIVLARTALLDSTLMFFVLLAFYFLLRDQRVRDIDRVVWLRPWLIAAGVSLGAATAIKWSGLYFLAAFGLYVVISEAIARKAAGHKNWLVGGILAQGSATFLQLVPVTFVIYLLSWTGWILTSGGYSRNATDNWFTSLIEYTRSAYGFHVSLATPHSYASNPLTWLFAIRPTSFFYEGLDAGEGSCTSAGGCSSAITALGNPLIWWSAAAAVFFVFFWYLKSRDRLAGLVLLGIAGGYVPWLFFMERTTFQFYAIAFLPWMILCLIFVARYFVGSAARPVRAQSFFFVYLLAAFAMSAFFLPIWIGTWIPYDFWYLHMWLPSWI